MNGELSLRERLLARKREIEDALAQLDRIEALADNAAPAPEVGSGPSIAQVVYEQLCGNQLTVKEIARKTGRSEKQIHNALTGHRLRSQFLVHDNEGERRYSIKPQFALPVERSGRKSSVSDGIIKVLQSDEERVWKTSEIAAELEGQVDSRAKDFKGAVAATLSNLARSGRVFKAKGGYQAPLKPSSDLK